MTTEPLYAELDRAIGEMAKIPGRNDRIRAEYADLRGALAKAREALWTCPDCAFSFAAEHTDADGGHSCPACAELRLAAELAEAQQMLKLYKGDSLGSLRDEYERENDQLTAERDQLRAERDELGEKLTRAIAALTEEIGNRERLSAELEACRCDNERLRARLEAVLRRFYVGHTSSGVDGCNDCDEASKIRALLIRPPVDAKGCPRCGSTDFRCAEHEFCAKCTAADEMAPKPHPYDAKSPICERCGGSPCDCERRWAACATCGRRPDLAALASCPDCGGSGRR